MEEEILVLICSLDEFWQWKLFLFLFLSLKISIKVQSSRGTQSNSGWSESALSPCLAATLTHSQSTFDQVLKSPQPWWCLRSLWVLDLYPDGKSQSIAANIYLELMLWTVYAKCLLASMKPQQLREFQTPVRDHMDSMKWSRDSGWSHGCIEHAFVIITLTDHTLVPTSSSLVAHDLMALCSTFVIIYVLTKLRSWGPPSQPHPLKP